MNNSYTSIIFPENTPKRLDAFLHEIFPKLTRSFIQNIIRSNKILVNNITAKPSRKLKYGEKISYLHSDFNISNDNLALKPYNFALDIIFENDDVIVINKPVGISVHPSSGQNNTIVNALLHYCPNIIQSVFDSGDPLSMARPGIVHRLDKDTSGVMIIAKNKNSLMFLSDQFKKRKVKKTYIALVYGWPKNESGRLINYLGRNKNNRMVRSEVNTKIGKCAVTDYEVLKLLTDKKFHKISLVKFLIHTGRTHQIRTQCKLIGNPILGDKLYFTKESKDLSRQYSVKRLMLHSESLDISINPRESIKGFTSSYPDEFSRIINLLSSYSN